MTAYSPGPHAMRLAANLGVLRTMRAWTFADLANALSPLPNGRRLHPASLWRVENALRWVTVDELFMFADVFDVDPVDLLLGQFTLMLQKDQP